MQFVNAKTMTNDYVNILNSLTGLQYLKKWATKGWAKTFATKFTISSFKHEPKTKFNSQ